MFAVRSATVEPATSQRRLSMQSSARLKRGFGIGLALLLGFGAFGIMTFALLFSATIYRFVLRKNIVTSPLVRFPYWYCKFAVEVCYIDASNALNTFPAAPTNGRPVSASVLPGASPIKTIFALRLPSPITGCALFLIRALYRGDVDNAKISWRITSTSCLF